jgi:hypothetical protein
MVSQRHASAALPMGKRPGTHFTGGWVDRFERVRKISPTPAFDFRTSASRHTDWAIPAHSTSATVDMNLKNMNIMANDVAQVIYKAGLPPQHKDNYSRYSVQNMFSCASTYDMLSQQLAGLLCQHSRRGPQNMYKSHVWVLTGVLYCSR